MEQQKPTVKQFRFINKVSADWFDTIRSRVEDFKTEEDPNLKIEKSEQLYSENFDVVMKACLASEDDELRVQLPRFLMYTGFKEYTRIIAEAQPDLDELKVKLKNLLKDLKNSGIEAEVISVEDLMKDI